MLRAFAVPLALLVAGAAGPAAAAPLLVISVDGLRPGDVVESGSGAARLPALAALCREGARAASVRGVLPSVTYPSHTTLMTGAWPAEHGIANNRVFDPTGKDLDAWYWYAEDVRVPTLWQAAHAAGLSTASVYWPVTVGARGIDVNLPQIWRSGQPGDAKLVRALATAGLLDWLEQEVGPPLTIADDPLEADARRGRYAERILERYRPQFMTAYFAAVDEAEHGAGPGSPAALAALERVDGYVGRLVEVARRIDPRTTIAVVSDHGFAPIRSTVQLLLLLADAGLVQLSPTGKVEGWQARSWGAGGSAMVVLREPQDAAMRARVGAVLDRLASDPGNGIERVIGQPEIAARGGSPSAAFFVNMRPGFDVGESTSGPRVTPAVMRGTHGYFPEAEAMRATFIIAGPEVPGRGSLGDIDMRDIAPTLARLLGVRLEGATGRPLF